MRDNSWMLEELYKIRAFADARGMDMSAEALRLSIIHVALERNLPTGLRVEELIREPNFELFNFKLEKAISGRA